LIAAVFGKYTRYPAACSASTNQYQLYCSWKYFHETYYAQSRIMHGVLAAPVAVVSILRGVRAISQVP